MNISMDGLRISLMREYEDLRRVLQRGVIKDSCFLDEVNIEEVEEMMDKLKQTIGILACVYEDKIEKDFNELTNTDSYKLLENFTSEV